MRVLVGTPCGGGQVTVQYMLSFMECINQVTLHKQELAREIQRQSPGFDHKNPDHAQAFNNTIRQHSYDLNLYTLAGESLIQRGRNHIAQVALSGAFDKLMFIDADAGWSWGQLKKILDTPGDVVAGLCPLKTYPISLNYLPYAEDEKFFEGGVRSVEGTKKMVEAHKAQLMKVPFVGTAFMCIGTHVLRALAETADHYVYPNPYTGEPESHWDFFKVESIRGTFLSEDWGLCHRARQAGFKVEVDTEVIITHTGNHTFRAV